MNTNKIKQLIADLKHQLEWSQPISRYTEIVGIVNAIEGELEEKEAIKVEAPKVEEKVVEAPKVEEKVVEAPKVEESKPKPTGRRK